MQRRTGEGFGPAVAEHLVDQLVAWLLDEDVAVPAGDGELQGRDAGGGEGLGVGVDVGVVGVVADVGDGVGGWGLADSAGRTPVGADVTRAAAWLLPSVRSLSQFSRRPTATARTVARTGSVSRCWLAAGRLWRPAISALCAAYPERAGTYTRR